METIYRIKDVDFTQEEIEQIINFWYTNGMCLSIFQDENGMDLEEFLNCQKDLNVKTIKKQIKWKN